jgi:beta-galactosidase
MVKVFRNHPSIIFWSMGNEAGDGPNFVDEYKAMRALDATRPIQYEGAQDSDHSDVKCPMYTRPWDVEKYVKNNPKKPFVLCEYTHAMGNSNGDIQDYWDLVRKYPSMQGGFIWDFVDQAVWKTDKRGTYLAYGGDFGDKPNDDNFNCNGIVAADRSYHPGAYEVKHAYQPIHVDAYDWASGEATVYNGWRFLSLDGVQGWWTIEREGRKIAEGKLDLSQFAPDSTKTGRVELSGLP